jgi:hypothetical protein
MRQAEDLVSANPGLVHAGEPTSVVSTQLATVLVTAYNGQFCKR